LGLGKDVRSVECLSSSYVIIVSLPASCRYFWPLRVVPVMTSIVTLLGPPAYLTYNALDRCSLPSHRLLRLRRGWAVPRMKAK